MAFAETTTDTNVHYRGLRDWLDKVQGIGELLCVNGAHWNTEMGSITQMLTEKSNGTAPAILNAIYHATGIRIRELPATPDKLVRAQSART